MGGGSVLTPRTLPHNSIPVSSSQFPPDCYGLRGYNEESNTKLLY